MAPFFDAAHRARNGPDGRRTVDEDYGALLSAWQNDRSIIQDVLRGHGGQRFRVGNPLCLDFFGANRVLFGTDCPFDPQGGPMFIRESIRGDDSLELKNADQARSLRQCGANAAAGFAGAATKQTKRLRAPSAKNDQDGGSGAGTARIGGSAPTDRQADHFLRLARATGLVCLVAAPANPAAAFAPHCRSRSCLVGVFQFSESIARMLSA